MDAFHLESQTGPEIVEIIDTPFPTFELQAGPGVNPIFVGLE
jgi:hypothetical protein